jgi:hypothetical protein
MDALALLRHIARKREKETAEATLPRDERIKISTGFSTSSFELFCRKAASFLKASTFC